jgi:epoxyqueuosine reductase
VNIGDGLSHAELQKLAFELKQWASELGFADLGITDTDPGRHEAAMQRWLQAGYHGEMDYMARHGSKRSRPAELEPGTLRVISVRMNYWPKVEDDNAEAAANAVLENGEKAYLSRYALGRDYHKVMRQRLKQLGERLEARVATTHYRLFVDSAPVLERGFAQKAGLGWIGKNTLLIHPQAGSLFFLGELFTNLPLPIDAPFDSQHCGSCSACLDLCPTKAFVGPHVLDARRCISYLTIELKGSIPEELRPLMGNRVFGCDDCQLVCPWNKFTRLTDEKDFTPRHQLDTADLIRLFNWTEAEFLQNTEGSPIRRTGYAGWLRNLAVGLGNAPSSPAAVQALRSREQHPSALVREHVRWALEQQRMRLTKTLVLTENPAPD